MALSFVEAADPDTFARAQELARELGVEARGYDPRATAGQPGVKLVVSTFGVTLGFVDPKRGKPLILDFMSAAWRPRFAHGLARTHIFRRALGVREDQMTMIDATAGFGQDAVTAACLGLKVTAVERSVAVAHVLRDAIERASGEDSQARECLARVSLVRADATEYLASHKTDIVYIDPMFEKPKSSAKSPKEMQLLQELLEPDPGGEAKLLEAALRAARARVIVKRPLKARASTAPSFSLKGQSIRYDVYVI